MMKSLRPSKRPPDPLQRLRLAAVALLVAAFVALYAFAGDVVPSALHALGAPLWRARLSAAEGLSGAAAFFADRAELRAENRALSAKLGRAEFELAVYRALDEERRKLVALLGREPDETALAAAVLVRPNLSPYDTLVIDAGAAQGIEAGARVFAAPDVPLGVIGRVFSKTAVVELFSTPGARTAVRIGTQGLQVEAEGQGGGNFVARVPQGVEILPGESVILPGISPELFAIVEQVTAEPSDPYQLVRFKNPVNLYELSYVLIERR